MQPRRYVEEDLATRLGVPVRTVQRWRQVGSGPKFLKLPSGAVRYTDEAIEEFEREMTRSSTSDTPKNRPVA